MKIWMNTVLAAVVFGGAIAGARADDKPMVGMSWFKFADERWKIDEAGIKKGTRGSRRRKLCVERREFLRRKAGVRY